MSIVKPGAFPALHMPLNKINILVPHVHVFLEDCDIRPLVMIKTKEARAVIKQKLSMMSQAEFL